jgi:hypothetical protein
VSARQGSFREVELPAAEPDIRTECRRCLRCDLEWAQHQEQMPATSTKKAEALQV